MRGANLQVRIAGRAAAYRPSPRARGPGDDVNGQTRHPFINIATPQVSALITFSLLALENQKYTF